MEQIEMEDIDMDGDLDLFYLSDNQLFHYKNDGIGDFDFKIKIAEVVNDISSYSIGDLDNDGYSDLVYIEENNLAPFLLYNDMSGGFQAPLDFNSIFGLDSVTKIEIIDINQDDFLDLIIEREVENSKEIILLKNDGQSNFVPTNQELDSDLLSIADFNGDDFLDIIGVQKIFLNDGFEQFTPVNHLPFEVLGTSNVYSKDFDLVDMDGNGFLDIVYSGWTDDIIGIYLNQDGTTFVDSILSSGTAITAIEPLDFDLDGDIDILFTKYWASSVFPLYIYRNDGDTAFVELSTNENVYCVSDIEAHDVDNDGILEISLATLLEVDIYGVSTSGNISTIDRLYPEFPVVGDLAIADLDNNGLDDLVIASSSNNTNTKVFFDTQLNRWLVEELSDESSANSDYYGTRHISLSDLNQDGYPDMVSTNRLSDELVVHLNNAGNDFNFSQLFGGLTSKIGTIDFIDVNEDGLQDIVSTLADHGTLIWFENVGSGQFNEPSNLVTDNAAYHAICDADNDGDLDIIYWQNNDDPVQDKLKLLKNLGNGNFESQEIASLGFRDDWSYIVPMHLNNDDLIDFLATGQNLQNQNYRLISFINQGNHSFSYFHGARPDHNYYNVPLQKIDLDLDGDLDIISFENYSIWKTRVWYENLGNGFFKDAVETPLLDHYALAYPFDFDDDSDPDILRISRGMNVLENQGSEGCTDPLACNYSSGAIVDNGTCAYSDCGCINELATNFNASAINDDGSCLFNFSANVFYDANGNGLYDFGDSELAGQTVTVHPGNIQAVSNLNGGAIFSNLYEGSMVLLADTSATFPYITTDQAFEVNLGSSSENNVFIGYNNTSDVFNLNLYNYGENQILCNSESENFVGFVNESSKAVSILIKYHFDPNQLNIQSSVEPDTIIENAYCFSFDAINPSETFNSIFNFDVPDENSLGTIVNSLVEAWIFLDGDTLFYGAQGYSSEIVCAYDPNDKQVFPIGEYETHVIPNDTTLEYFIRFQNTGNFPAQNIWVRDTLDPNLDLTTFSFKAASHNVNTILYPESRMLEFYFPDIMLADSVNNEPESHGFVSFTIKPKEELMEATLIKNKAEIYFDFNAPIVTNEVFNTITHCFASNFEEAPQGLWADQSSASHTELQWDHYSLASRGCIIEGGTIGEPNLASTFTEEPGSFLVQGQHVNGLPDGFDNSGAFLPDDQFTLFSPLTFPNGLTGVVIPEAHYKWRVRCGCVIDWSKQIPQRFNPSNIHISPWSEYSLFTNLGSAPSQSIILDLEAIKEEEFTVFPNPFADEVLIRFKKEVPKEIHLVNSVGQFISITVESNQQESRIETSGLASGIYVLRLMYPDKTLSQTILKN
ncbi:MAG: T9SS type A sorting domain-containing protein [Bacteroidota bacterium]